MEWIKAKYDRVLLGFCGLVALIVGVILLMNALGWKKQFTSSPDAAGNRENFGTSDADKTAESALTLLKTPLELKAPYMGETPLRLFTSVPVVKKVGEPELIPIYPQPGKEPKLIRPPVSNVWLFENGLPLLQVNVLELDSDNDKFTNLEEYGDPKTRPNDTTKPNDSTSHPEVAVKIQYRELIEVPLSLRFNAISSPTEITFRVTTASPETSYTTKPIGPGGKIQNAKTGGEDRFVITKVDASVTGKEFAILDDLKTKKTGIKALFREEVHFPTYQAKLVCTLGKEEEKTVSVGDEIYFEVDPEQKYTVKDITPTETTLEYTPKGTSEKKTLPIKIPPPP